MAISGALSSHREAYLTAARMVRVLGALAVVLLAVLLVAIAHGAVRIDLLRALRDPASPDHAILMAARLPRVLMGALVGAVLATAGAALQALVRNPLAEGGTLGISAAAAFGAILPLVFSYRLGISEALAPGAGFVLALLSTLLVYRLGQVRGRLDPLSLLLVGVIFNTFWSALILLINNLVDLYQTRGIMAWLVGSLEAPSYTEIGLVAMPAAAGSAWLYWHARDLNLLALSEDSARDLGVDVEGLRRGIFVATSVMIGAAVSVSGMIGFVGLIVPHLIRLRWGPDHRLLLPAAMLSGAGFLVVADLIARLAIAPAELPVGVITALCGAPFFIYLLRRDGARDVAL
ncbi:MAG TPA: iron ABC transporter permease [Candidatus Binataceae bacterium]|nr:iron ABC transporter permease [Candidatus Binataceae bacterium]